MGRPGYGAHWAATHRSVSTARTVAGPSGTVTPWPRHNGTPVDLGDALVLRTAVIVGRLDGR
jgi:hypothetical protein